MLTISSACDAPNKKPQCTRVYWYFVICGYLATNRPQTFHLSLEKKNHVKSFPRSKKNAIFPEGLKIARSWGFWLILGNFEEKLWKNDFLTKIQNWLKIDLKILEGWFEVQNTSTKSGESIADNIECMRCTKQKNRNVQGHIDILLFVDI